MTKNQIEYNKLLEAQRSNIAQEMLTRRRDQNNFDLGSRTLAETNRHNLVVESQNKQSLDETSRHNKASEKLGRDTLREQSRHNQAVELETNRSNVARERETSRSNRAQEKIASQRLSLDAQYRQSQLGLQAAANAEQARSNAAREAETARSNRESERIREQQNAESARANRASEAIRRTQNDIQYRHLGIEQANVEIRDREVRGKNYNTPGGIVAEFEDTIRDKSQKAQSVLGKTAQALAALAKGALGFADKPKRSGVTASY